MARHSRRISITFKCVDYLATCATLEHFLEYRPIVQDSINAQLAEHLAIEAKAETPTPAAKELTVYTYG